MQTPLTMTSGGLPRYVSELAAALTKTFPADRFLLSSDQTFASALPRLPGPANRLERRWWLYGAEKANARANATLFHGTNFAVPYFARRPTVLTVHDLSPWLNPAWHFEAERVRARTPGMLRRAAMIVTPSEAVRREVMDRFSVSAERIVATPLAAAAIFRPTPAPVAKPYFLFVGTLEPRKNIPMLLEAWREVRKQNKVDLILAGRRRADGPEIKPEPGLQVLGETPEEQLPRLYSNAMGVVYASEYEGFGLPVLEAMQCGVPVIISHNPALNEVAAGAAMRAGNAVELAAAMRALGNYPAARVMYSAKSLARAGDFLMGPGRPRSLTKFIAKRWPVLAVKRALMLSPETPYPLHGGGALRTASLLNYLRRDFEVDLIVFRHLPTQDPASVLPLGLVRHVQVVDLPHHRKDLLARAARNSWRLARGVPPLVDRFRGYGRQLQLAAHYDVAVIEHFWCAEYLEQIGRVSDRVILNLHNVESVLHETCATAETGAPAWAHRRFAESSRRMERRWLPRFTAILTASREDAARVRAFGADNVTVYPERHSPDSRSHARRRRCHCLLGQSGIPAEPDRRTVFRSRNLACAQPGPTRL